MPSEKEERADVDIVSYGEEHLVDVLNLLQSNLWHDPLKGMSYFKWKYHDNPYTEEPLCIVAMLNGKVVGFRGYMALRWQVGDKRNRTTVLVPGDTVVDPAQQRNGLSVAMGRVASEYFAAKAPIFLNMTAGRNSVPGYLRLDFAPLQAKTYLTRCSLIEDIRAVSRNALGRRRTQHALPLAQSRVRFGDFGDVLVRQAPLPAEMSLVASSGDGMPAKIALLQDEKFFDWRYANPCAKYVFYLAKQGPAITAYLAMRLSDDNRRGLIVDFGQKDDNAMARILRHIEGAAEFDAVSILEASVEDDLQATFMKFGFARRNFRRALSNLYHGTWPILVRPTRQDCSEADWSLFGLDIRRAENWHIKSISSDSV